MKHITKLASLLLAIVMLFALALPVFAADEVTGTIKIDHSVQNQTYTIYRILDLESFSSSAYSYKVNNKWKAFFENGAGKDYIAVDAQGYATWKNTGVSEAVVADLAKAALQWAKDNSIANEGSKPGATGGITFENLELGYYLVDTTVGTLCALNTLSNTVTVASKNVAPVVSKQVKEDSTGNYGADNTAQIGDKIEYKVTVSIKRGAQNYVLHDSMTEGLTFNNDVVIKHGETALTPDTDYTVVTENLVAPCTFEIRFKQEYLNGVGYEENSRDVVITYSATLNDKAAVSTGANKNTIQLRYGENNDLETTPVETSTYTFFFDLIKTNTNNEYLSDAKFELYDAKTEGNKIDLVLADSNANTYRIATAAEKAENGFVSAVINTVGGKAKIVGLDAGTTYYLEEIEAPAGYNKLAARVDVVMGNENREATFNQDGSHNNNGVKVENKAGSVLPSTGGMGTTLFYIVGAVLMLGAVIVLVAKKRTAYDE